jgi:hypothetical protein
LLIYPNDISTLSSKGKKESKGFPLPWGKPLLDEAAGLCRTTFSDQYLEVHPEVISSNK